MIVKSVLLPLDRAAAFRLFTERISAWWPPERRHTKDAESTIVLSAEEGFFERARTGERVALGAIRAWEPPERIVLDWYPGTDREHPTSVEVRFVAEPGATRVEVRHGPGAKSTDLFPIRAPRYEASWDLVLAAVRAAATVDS